jgi:hypothetical protein
MGFQMRKLLTDSGLQSPLKQTQQVRSLNSSNGVTPFYQKNEFSEGKVISQNGGTTTLQRQKVNTISGQKMSNGPAVDLGENTLYNNLISSPKDLAKMEELGINIKDQDAVISYGLNKGKDQQNTVIQEKTIDVVSGKPIFEDRTEVIESLPLFGNQQNYDNVNWRGMAIGLKGKNSMLFTGLLGDFSGRKYMRTPEDELLKMAYDSDPVAFEERMRALYPGMFSSKNKKPAANTRTTRVEVSPGSSSTNESEWETVSDETIDIEN